MLVRRWNIVIIGPMCRVGGLGDSAHGYFVSVLQERHRTDNFIVAVLCSLPLHDCPVTVCMITVLCAVLVLYRYDADGWERANKNRTNLGGGKNKKNRKKTGKKNNINNNDQRK